MLTTVHIVGILMGSHSRCWFVSRSRVGVGYEVTAPLMGASRGAKTSLGSFVATGWGDFLLHFLQKRPWSVATARGRVCFQFCMGISGGAGRELEGVGTVPAAKPSRYHIISACHGGRNKTGSDVTLSTCEDNTVACLFVSKVHDATDSWTQDKIRRPWQILTIPKSPQGYRACCNNCRGRCLVRRSCREFFSGPGSICSGTDRTPPGAPAQNFDVPEDV